MIIEPTTLTARQSLIDPREVNILLNLVNDSSTNVRLNTLDTLTHLPLPEQGWTQVVKLIRQELREAKSLEDKGALLAIGTWIPNVFNLEDEVRKIEEDSVKRDRLIDAVRRIQHQYSIRKDHDREWESSQAPGFVLLSESELLVKKSYLEPQVPIVTSKLSNVQDFTIEDPVLITLLFESAAKDNHYRLENVWLINNLLKKLGSIEDFRPDLCGLFEEYLRCISGWIRDRSSRYGEPNGRWFQLRRDDEDPYSWRSWQIAWTVSRGGLKGLISSLTIHLTADDETRQIAALALIADSADYVLQRSAPGFGGGQRPSRSAPHKQITFRVSVSHPKRLAKGFASPILVNLYLPQLNAEVEERLRKRFKADLSKDEFDANLPKEGEVRVGLSSPDIEFSEPAIRTLRGGDVHIEFTAKPNDKCRPGEQFVKLFIEDPGTKKEFLSRTFPLVVTDYVVDHLSQPLLSKLYAAVGVAGSISIFILTFFHKIDLTFGLPSGTALLFIISLVLARYKNLFGRPLEVEIDKLDFSDN